MEVQASEGRAGGGQQSGPLDCLKIMARKKMDHDRKPTRAEGDAYDLSTPLWSRYYQAMRKRIKFPRYYKKALNW